MNKIYFTKKGTSEYWQSLYDAYKRKRNEVQSKGYLLEEQYSLEGFKDSYLFLEEKKGITKNKVRALVNGQKLISYERAQTNLLQQNPNAKLSYKNIREYLYPERVRELINQPWIMFGREVSNRGMSTSQAYFAYMSEIGMKEEAEKDYGY